MGVGKQELEVRDQSRALVEQHWPEIGAVAEELIRVRILDDTQVETLVDIATGIPGVTMADLELSCAQTNAIGRLDSAI